MQLISYFNALYTRLKWLKPTSHSVEYQQWRHRFLLERLYLAGWIALIANSTFLLLNLFIVAAPNALNDTSNAISQQDVLEGLIEFSAVELSLLLGLLLLRIPWARRYPSLLFLGFSWSLTVLSQIQGTLRGEVVLDIVALTLVFPAQAILMPACWHLHLVSQVSALGYHFLSVTPLFGLNNLHEQEPLTHAMIGLYFFWVCLICDLGAYLYERLQQREFESRQQLRVFLHAVSHDLRNPVLGTVMVLKNLLNQAGEKVQVSRSVLERIIDSSDRQLDLINSLLEAHSTEVRGIALHCQPLQLNPLTHSVIDDLQPMLTKEQATLANLISPELPRVNADPLQLSRVYQNLITNALKHNPPGLSLMLNAKIEGDWVRCTVTDDGVGMSQEHCEKLFDLYFRGSQIRQSIGLGLGLYLCRQIITAHGGEIGVNSRLKQGTSFWFTLPLAVSPTSDPTFGKSERNSSKLED